MHGDHAGSAPGRPRLAGSVGAPEYHERSGSGALADLMKEHDQCHD